MPGLKSEGPLLGRIWHDFFFSLDSLNSLSLTVLHSVPQVLAGLRVSDITPQQPNQRKMDSQRFVDLFNSISFSFFPPFFWCANSFQKMPDGSKNGSPAGDVQADRISFFVLLMRKVLLSVHRCSLCASYPEFSVHAQTTQPFRFAYYCNFLY